MGIVPICAILVLSATTLGAEGPDSVRGRPAGQPRFTKKPVATRAGPGARIEFAVDRETDVAVFVEDAGGTVIRHLVAGVLGRNPPAPLRAGTLDQSVEWDGKADYGKPAEGAPFKVRVALGMGARYDKVLLSDPNTFHNIKGLAVGPDGTLYVLNKVGGTGIWHGEQILGFDRDGRYRRTVSPFPTNLSLDQVKDFGAFEVDGRPTALVHRYETLQLFPGEISPRKTGMAVTPDGTAVIRLAGNNNISVVGTGGEAVWGNPGGPPLRPPDKDGTFRGDFSQPFLAVSPDGRWAYFSGCMASRTDNRSGIPAVFRAPLPDRTPAVPFFGDPLKAGKGQTLLGGVPRGLAADGKGHLLIADAVNNRVVVVAEADGQCVGEFAAENPDGLAAAATAGTIYLTRSSGKAGLELLKYNPKAGSGPGGGWQDVRETARLPLRADGNGSHVMALDDGARPPVVWIGTDGGTLWRIEDLGDRFGEPRIVSNRNAGMSAYMDVTVDRSRKEVYTRMGTGVQTGTWWWRFSEETGTCEKVIVREQSGAGTGPCLLAAPDGNLYGLQWPYRFIKWDRGGNPLAWDVPENPATYINKENKTTPVARMPAHHKYVPVSEIEMPHWLGVRWSDGHLFVLQPGRPGDTPPKALHEYLPNGKHVTTDPILWKTGHFAIGPRFDAAGNIYVADFIRPKGWLYPDEFQKFFESAKVRWKSVPHETAIAYGSIVKFGPKGGMIHVPERGGSNWSNPFNGEPKLDPSLRSAEADEYSRGGRLEPIKVTGAEWIHPGISHVGSISCCCEAVTFDVDEFGRVFFPDTGLHRVRVIDTAGNALATFGGYGNADSMGPESPVIDAKTHRVRPRRPDDPKDLGSPLAEPEIAFAWIIGVSVTDKYMYTGDSINRRLMRLMFTYASESVCEVN